MTDIEKLRERIADHVSDTRELCLYCPVSRNAPEVCQIERCRGAYRVIAAEILETLADFFDYESPGKMVEGLKPAGEGETYHAAR